MTLLAEALEQSVQTPTEHDWSFRADDREGGFNRYHWGLADQRRFDSCWSARAEQLARSLVVTYTSMWPWAFPRAVTARLPDFAGDIMELCRQRLIGQGHHYADRPDIVCEHALQYGAFDHMRALLGPGGWPGPGEIICAICRGGFLESIVSPWMIRQYGPARYCPACCVRARDGRRYRDKGRVVAGLRELAAAIEGVPEQAIAATICIAGLPSDRRDRAMAGLIVAPNVDSAKAWAGTTWLQVLQTAGLVGDAWRPGRGTYCVAADGHACRSLAERTIDDFLSAHHVAHDPEPRYPGSNMRADWSLPGGRYVEFAGMLSDAEYSAKIQAKRELAVRCGVELVVLVPEDLTDLEDALAFN
jgi:hypothetical protein